MTKCQVNTRLVMMAVIDTNTSVSKMNLTMLFLFITRTVEVKSNWTKPIRKICNEYFDPYVTAVFTDGKNNLMDEIFQTLGPVIIYDINQPVPEAQQQFKKPRNVLIVLASPESAKNLHGYFFFHAQSRILVITLDSPKIWLDSLWRRTQAINAVIFSLDDLKFYTWFPYKPDECTTVTTITELSKNFYPEKLGSNLNKCNLRLACQAIYPYNFNETDGNYQEGVETNIMITFAKKYNLTRKLLKTEPEFFWSGIVPGVGPMGGLRFVHENLADFAVGGLSLNNDFLQYSDSSLPYYDDSLSWFVPIPNFIPNVEKIPKTISGNYRMILSATITLITITSAIIAHVTGSSVIDSIFNSIRANIFSPIIMPRNRTLKLLTMFTYFFSMHITIGFQSALIYLLANDVSEIPITDITQALDRNMKFYFYDFHRHLINQSESFLTNAIMERKLYNFATAPNYAAFVFNKTGVMLAPRTPAPYYFKFNSAVDRYGRLIMTPLRDAFMPHAIIILSVKGHPLLPLFDKTSQQLREAGLIDLWLRRILPNESINIMKENVPLSIEALIGAFIILGILSLLSLIVFIFEVLVYNFFYWRIKHFRKKRVVHFFK